MKRSDRKKVGKATARAKKKPSRAAKSVLPLELGHEARFDQLLDDAVFGVKKK